MRDFGETRYLLVTHIPFARNLAGNVVLDELWAKDLEGLVASGWNLRVCAPQLSSEFAIRTWGPSSAVIPAGGPIQFVGFPPIESRLDTWKWGAIRAILGTEVRKADLVHTSNLFPPYTGLAFAHDLAVRLRRKTIYVIAEDFHDMLDWEFVRVGKTARQIARRRRHLESLHKRSLKSASSASLTFLHTPAAVKRYRLAAKNGIAIRQPGHELEDVITAEDFSRKIASIQAGDRLIIVVACRHKALKGLDLLIQALALARKRGTPVEARIYGKGSETEALQSLAVRSGVGDLVKFLGSVPPGSSVYRVIREGHLFAMPHRTTDFGRAFFDAMASGTPVLAFRTPASIETVRDGLDGLLTSLDDIEDLAGAISRLHSDRELLARLSESARERAIWNTRSEWYRLRAGWTKNLFEENLVA